MSKGDVEIPKRVPSKRRELERALPAWLAVWANDESLSEADRRRAQGERDRRKAANPDPLVVGLVIGREGATPAQVGVMRGFASGPNVVKVMAPIPVKLNLAPNVFVLERELREIVKVSGLVVAAPKETYKPTTVHGVWGEVRHAKQLGVPVLVVLPDGQLHKQV